MANKFVIEVLTGAGLSLNSPYTDHSREYAIDADDWDLMDENEQMAIFAERLGEASGYAQHLATVRPGFWVRTEVRWPN